MVAGLATAVVAASPALADVTQVSGSASGEQVNHVNALGLTDVNSPATPSVTLPSSGGNESTNLASAKVPASGGILSAGVLNVSTSGTTGSTGSSTSSASVANANALTGAVTATLISSTCTANSSGTTGSTTLTGLSINGQPAVDLSPPPNTELINAAGLRVVANEQSPTAGPGQSAITVNALHIYLSSPLGSGDIILAQSHCDVVNAPSPVVPEVTLAILLPASALAVFGVATLMVRRRRPERTF